MQLAAVGREWDVLTVYLVLRLGEGWGVGMAVGRYAEIIEAVAPRWWHSMAAHGILAMLR